MLQRGIWAWWAAGRRGLYSPFKLKVAVAVVVVVSSVGVRVPASVITLTTRPARERTSSSTRHKS